VIIKELECNKCVDPEAHKAKNVRLVVCAGVCEVFVKPKVGSLTRTSEEPSVMTRGEFPGGSGMDVLNYNYNIKIARLIQRISGMHAASDLDK
jgi:hypothetical protein